MKDGTNGTICLGSHLTKQGVVQKCKEWLASGSASSKVGRGLNEEVDATSAWLESMGIAYRPTNQPRRGRRVNVTLCAELEAAIDPHCSFDIEPVRSFTRDVRRNGGDWTAAFWVKSLGKLSELADTGLFFPHLNFLSSISPPTHNLQVRSSVFLVAFCAVCAD